MANGDHISHNDNTNQPADNNAKAANDSLFNAAYDNAGANAKVADNAAKVGDQTVAQAPAASAEKALDVSQESPSIQDRFKDGPQAGLAQSHENISKLFASMTTQEGQDMLKNCIKDFCSSQAAHPALAAQFADHAGK